MPGLVERRPHEPQRPRPHCIDPDDKRQGGEDELCPGFHAGGQAEVHRRERREHEGHHEVGPELARHHVLHEDKDGDHLAGDELEQDLEERVLLVDFAAHTFSS